MQAWSPHYYRQDINLLEAVQRRAAIDDAMDRVDECMDRLDECMDRDG